MSKYVLNNTDDRIILTILEPRLFRALELVCKDAISLSNNHPAMRRSVGSVYFQLRTAAIERCGHETPDVIAIKSILDRTAPEGIRRVPVKEVLTALYEKGQLDADEIRAGKLIADIWRAFGRFLTVVSRSYDNAPAGQRTRTCDPADVMGSSLNANWRDYYCPWYEVAKHKLVPSKVAYMGYKTRAALVLYVIVEQMMPRIIDKAFKLPRNTTITVVKEELDALAMRMKPESDIRSNAHVQVSA